MNNLKLPFFRWQPTARLVSISTFPAHVAVVINIKWYNSLCNKREMRFYLAAEWRRKILLRVFSTKTNIGPRMTNKRFTSDTYGFHRRVWSNICGWSQVTATYQRRADAFKTVLYFKVSDFIVYIYTPTVDFTMFMRIFLYLLRLNWNFMCV